MAREISPVLDFIFGSIRTGLPMDTVDVELMVRMVKGIYMYRKKHMTESTVFSPWSRTVTPFIHCEGKYRLTKMRITRCQHGIKDMLHLIPLPNPSLSVDVPQGRPEPGGLTGGTDYTQLRQSITICKIKK